MTGVPITRQRFDQMRSMFEEYVKNRTLQNWKFWIVSCVQQCVCEFGWQSSSPQEALIFVLLAVMSSKCSFLALFSTFSFDKFFVLINSFFKTF